MRAMTQRKHGSLVLAAMVCVLAMLLGGCGAATSAPATLAPPTAVPTATPLPPSPTPEPFALTSTAFADGALIPADYSCHGKNISPPLAWNAPPAATQSLALIMDDPDAVPVAGHVWDHWLLFNLPGSLRSLAQAVPAKDELPDGSRHGQNSSGGLRYDGPCPPANQTHGYVFTLYALDQPLDLKAGATKDQILQAVKGHTLAQAQLVGTYASP